MTGMVNLGLAIVVTIVALGILIIDVRCYSEVKQNIEMLWGLCRQYADFMRDYDEELKGIAKRLQRLEERDR